MRYAREIESFHVIRWHDFRDRYQGQLKAEIESQTKDYLLGVEGSDYIEHLIDKYTLEPLTIEDETEAISEPVVEKEIAQDMFGDRFEQQIYKFNISYRFLGSPVLFEVYPNPANVITQKISIDESRNIVSFNIKISKKDPNEFNSKKQQCYSNAFSNINNVNNNAAQWNSSLNQIVEQLFEARKKHFLQENDFFTAINVKVNKNTSSIFTAPTVKKKIIPKPSKPENVEFVSEPAMSKDMYNDVLKVIYDAGKNMEKKGSGLNFNDAIYS